MVIDLGIIFFTLANLSHLLGNPEGQLVCLEPIFGHSFIHTTSLYLTHVIDICLLFGDLLDITFATVDPHFRLCQSSQDIGRHCVDMQLSLTLEACDTKVLLVVVWVELWEGKSLVDAVNAAKYSTEVALGELLALPLRLGLATDPTILLGDLS